MMMQWIYNNAGNILVVAILGAAVTAVILSMRKARKAGKSACGGCCDQCASRGICH